MLLPLPFPTSGALCFTEQAQFHPLKFAYALAKDLTVYENTRVLNLEKNHAVTENGEIFARHIIVATHFPFLRLRGLYFLKMHQYRSYISALSHAPQVDGMYLDAEGRGLSLRNYKEFLLLGGGGHPTGAQGGGWETLKIYRKKYFPDAAEVYRFAAQDCVTLDDIPYIGYYGKPSDGMFVATGFNNWGMTSSMVAAELLKDLITEKESPYTEVFSPSRSMVRPRLFLHVGKNTWNLLRPTAPRCPHLGCALRYNSAEHTWDCPCHGSRFTKDGACIDSPANRDHK